MLLNLFFSKDTSFFNTQYNTPGRKNGILFAGQIRKSFGRDFMHYVYNLHHPQPL